MYMNGLFVHMGLGLFVHEWLLTSADASGGEVVDFFQWFVQYVAAAISSPNEQNTPRTPASVGDLDGIFQFSHLELGCNTPPSFS